MEKFINNLYSNSNFPIILFSLIGIFVVLFIITLILALRDAKKYNREDLKPEEATEEEEESNDSDTKVFEDITFNKDEEKTAESSKKEEFAGVSFANNEKENETEAKEDVILDTTTRLPVLKDEEISNFEEFFLENLKEKKNNVFDFSKIEDKEITDKMKNNELDFNSDVAMELPKKKAEYSFKDIDGESYKINK